MSSRLHLVSFAAMLGLVVGCAAEEVTAEQDRSTVAPPAKALFEAPLPAEDTATGRAPSGPAASTSAVAEAGALPKAPAPEVAKAPPASGPATAGPAAPSASPAKETPPVPPPAIAPAAPPAAEPAAPPPPPAAEPAAPPAAEPAAPPPAEPPPPPAAEPPPPAAEPPPPAAEPPPPAAEPPPPAAEPPPPPAAEPPPPASADPGAAPAGVCSVDKNADGFFTRTSSASAYVAYVPPTYSADRPMRVVVGLHGCSDDAMNFATWAVNPWSGRATQDYIGISVGGESGNNRCWKMGVDDAKVLAAVEDLAKCFWLDRARVVVAGYSSGGQLAYRVGMMNASSFAGILVSNSALYAAGGTTSDLLAGAARKIPVAHRARTGDSVFPIAKVQADWQATREAGFPITTSELAGGHDGKGEDWSGWLLPLAKGWVLPAR
jgi:predicted esterase